jgi:hypothetical protein
MCPVLVKVLLLMNRQASCWGEKITYPPPSIPQTGTNFTSHMTPVAHLAREGYVPSAMAMVLCNDPDIQGFCNMVQGLHQEGVVRHSIKQKRGRRLTSRRSTYRTRRNYHSCSYPLNSIVPITSND